MAEPKTAPAASPATAEPVDDPLWDDWDTPPRIDPVPVLHLDGFDGPMDLLLDLVERQRIDLGRISVVALVAQFVAATERLVNQVSIERRAEWLVLATRLVLLRSRLLFPATKEAAHAAEAEAAREVARLGEMQFIRAAAAWMERRPWLGRDVFARPAQGPDPRASSYMAFMEACLVVLRGREEQPAVAPFYRPALAPLFRISDALTRLRPLVAAMTGPQPLHALLPRLAEAVKDNKLVRRSAMAATFVAALELCRDEVIGLEQADPFKTITLVPHTAETAECDSGNSTSRRASGSVG